jgi:hypothetical protein
MRGDEMDGFLLLAITAISDVPLRFFGHLEELQAAVERMNKSKIPLIVANQARLTDLDAGELVCLRAIEFRDGWAVDSREIKAFETV